MARLEKGGASAKGLVRAIDPGVGSLEDWCVRDSGRFCTYFP